MTNKLFHSLMNHKFLYIAVIFCLTSFFTWQAIHAKFDNTLEVYFFEKDVKQYDRFLEQFGSDEIIAVAFSDDSIWSTRNLQLIDRLSKKIARLPHVTRLTSLTTADIAWGDSDMTYFSSLVESISKDTSGIALMERRAREDPFIPGIILSDDGKTTAVVAEVEHIKNEFDYKVELISSIRKIIAAEEQITGKTFHLAGTSIVDDAVFRYNQRDQSLFMPVMAIFILFMIYLFFRRILWIFLPFMIVVLSVIWTYGALVFLGFKINIISSIITPLLMAVSIADSIHFMASYFHEAGDLGKSRQELIQLAFSNVLTPCFLTSLTTIFGLLSLMVSDLAPIRQFGLVGAFGVFSAFLLSIILLPMVLMMMPRPDTTLQQSFGSGRWFQILAWLGTWKRTRSVIILLFTMIVFIGLLPQVYHLQVGTNSLDYLRQHDPVRKQIEWIDGAVGGSISMEFMLEADGQDAFIKPLNLQKIERFQSYLRQINGITGAFSLTDLVKALNRAYNSGQKEFFSIPSSETEIAQYLLLVEDSDELTQLVSDDYRIARVSARVKWADSRYVSHMVPEIEKKINEIFGPDIRVTPTGLVMLMNRMEHYIVSSQVNSFSLAFFVIFCIIMITFRSVKVGLLAIIPNFLPIVFSVIIMPVLNIALDVGTLMIAGVALGLIVDDTIHFLNRFTLESRKNGSIHGSLYRTMITTGRPIFYTSVILGLGVLVLGFASFKPVVNFGLLLSLVIFLALFFDLLVLPAIIGFFDRGTSRKKDA